MTINDLQSRALSIANKYVARNHSGVKPTIGGKDESLKPSSSV
jgi:hypothetical protein